MDEHGRLEASFAVTILHCEVHERRDGIHHIPIGPRVVPHVCDAALVAPVGSVYLQLGNGVVALHILRNELDREPVINRKS